MNDFENDISREINGILENLEIIAKRIAQEDQEMNEFYQQHECILKTMQRGEQHA